MRIKYFFAILSILLASALSTQAQLPSRITDSVSALFTKFARTRTDKNVVLLTSREIYTAGEKIWFKAYVINTDAGMLDLLSKNLFADIVNERDSIIEQLVLDNRSLRTDGAFNLPASLPTGFYWIRCYTASQLKTLSSGIFIHPVFVINKQLHDESSYVKRFENTLRHSNNSSPVIHFFAERLTTDPGIISTGVIEIRNENNDPLLVKGELVNSKDSIITNFKTNSFGLARLTFVNDTAEKYTVIFYADEQTTRYQLPAFNKTSIQLSVVNQTDKTIKAIVTLEESVPVDMHTTLLAVQHDSLYYAAVGTGNYGITIPIDNFPGGIMRLLLFDANKNLVGERNIYIPKENVELDIKPNKKKYSARENVDVHIKVKDANGQPLASILNVAVEDEWIANFSDSVEANALPPTEALLLDSWLKKYHTNYSADDIDLLMITRRTTFQPLADTGLNKEIHDFDDNRVLQNLIGKIVNRKGSGVSGRIVTTIARNSHEFFMDVDTTDNDGTFNLSMPQGFDSLQLSLQVTDKHQVQRPEDSIKIESFHYPNFSTPLSLKQQFLAGNVATLSLVRKYHIDTTTIFHSEGVLAPVTVKAIKKEELNYDASRRINSISQILTSDKFRNGGQDALGNAILTVPGVSYLNGDITIFGPSFHFPAGIERPMVIMDGSEVPKNIAGGVIAFLNSLNPADIDFIEVLRGGEAAQYGSRGAAGVVSINTKHGPSKADYSHSNLRVFIPVTYHVSPKFEMPDYSKSQIKNSSTPDPRTTIYWSSNIATGANGEAHINFYTADGVTNYTITITGLTEKGDLVYKRIIIENKGKAGK